MMTKILLVEDDPTMRDLLTTLLGFEGFEVLSSDGKLELDTTLDILHREAPALVLLDVHLRQFSGFDLLQRIRQDERLKGMRVLMSSGMELRGRCADEGADGFILKPYMPDDLVAKIRQLLD